MTVSVGASVERVIATCSTAACNALPAGVSGENKLEKFIAENMPTAIAADFAPLEARVIDEDTYVQQGHDLEAAYGDAVLEYILGTLQPNTDVALVGYPVTDEFSHQFMALITPTDPDGDPNPTYDDTDYNGVPDGRVAAREAYIRSAYQGADTKLGIARGLMGGNPTTFAGSDHGFAPAYYAVNANKVLTAATVHNTVTNTDVSLHASNANATNCGAVAADLAKACWAGGTIQVYVNTTLPAGITAAAVRTAARNAFASLTDTAHPGAQVVLRRFIEGARLDPDHDYRAETYAIRHGAERYARDFTVVHREIKAFSQVYDLSLVAKAPADVPLEFASARPAPAVPTYARYRELVRDLGASPRDPLHALARRSATREGGSLAQLVRQPIEQNA